jgi:hypothetical protein
MTAGTAARPFAFYLLTLPWQLRFTRNANEYSGGSAAEVSRVERLSRCATAIPTSCLVLQRLYLLGIRSNFPFPSS